MTHLEALLAGLPSETKSQILDLIRKEKFLDEDDVLFSTSRVMAIYGLFYQQLDNRMSESVDKVVTLAEKTINKTDLARIDTTTQNLKSAHDDLSSLIRKSKSATYALNFIAIIAAFLQGLFIGALLDAHWVMGATAIAIFLGGMATSTFLRAGYRLVLLWFQKAKPSS